MSSGSYYEEEMSSGGHRRLTAFILWPFSPSKKSPLDPPSPWSWLGAYLILHELTQPTCSSGALWSVGCVGGTNSSVISNRPEAN